VTSRDITRLKQTEKRLVESERRYRRIFESGLGLICTHDLEGRLLSVNAAAAHSLGYEPADLAGVQLRDHLAPEVRDQFDAYLARIRRNGTDAGLMLVLDRQGQTRTWKYHNALLSETGAPDYVLGHAQDVTALKHAQEIAESLSFTDDLTGLYNRRGFFALAEQHLKLARAPRTKKGTLLVYTDMDGLKAINDAHGHDQGSRALVAVAELLRRTFRESDILARLGGDEFVILSISATDQDERAIRDRLEAALQEYNAARLHPFVLSLSVGTAVVDSERRRSLDELLKAADEQMYEEKRRKKV
jgi:diguanylate cyclase (GGDEF)-like protein/PAS domain S-box-containing protein